MTCRLRIILLIYALAGYQHDEMSEVLDVAVEWQCRSRAARTSAFKNYKDVLFAFATSLSTRFRYLLPVNEVPLGRRSRPAFWASKTLCIPPRRVRVRIRTTMGSASSQPGLTVLDESLHKAQQRQRWDGLLQVIHGTDLHSFKVARHVNAARHHQNSPATVHLEGSFQHRSPFKSRAALAYQHKVKSLLLQTLDPGFIGGT